MTDIKAGDMVKITIEARVRAQNSTYLSFDSPATPQWGGEVRKELATIEKIDPPVEVFKPGDLVRDKETGWLFAIGEGGYVRTGDRAGQRRFEESSHQFTSKDYERVDL